MLNLIPVIQSIFCAERTALDDYITQAIKDAEIDSDSDGSMYFLILGLCTGPIGIVISAFHKSQPKIYRFLDKPEIYVLTYKDRYISARRKKNVLATLLGFIIMIAWIVIGRLLNL